MQSKLKHKMDIIINQKTVSEKAITEVSNQLLNFNITHKVLRISKNSVYFLNELGTTHLLFLCKIKNKVEVIVPEYSILN